MRTITEVLDEFLEEQEARVKPRTYSGYKDTIWLFKQCANGYAYNYLDKKDSARFDELHEEGREFCDIFGPDHIDSTIVSEFLDYFVIRKVMAGRDAMKTYGRVMKELVKWLHEKGYMVEDEYEDSAERVEELKGDLPKVSELSDLIYDYIQNSVPVDTDEIEEGYFAVTKVQPGKLWLAVFAGITESIGPVIVSREISDLCQVGWTINLVLGKTKKGWRMLEGGNVYPE